MFKIGLAIIVFVLCSFLIIRVSALLTIMGLLEALVTTIPGFLAMLFTNKYPDWTKTVITRRAFKTFMELRIPIPLAKIMFSSW